MDEDALAKISDELFGGGETAQPIEAPAQQPQVDEAAPQAAADAAQPVDQQPGQPVPQPEAKPEEHTVPLAKFLDQRDELKELKRWRQEQEAKTSKPAGPDPFDDQEKGFVSAEVAKVRFEMSDVMARQTHGAEKVDAAAEWAMQKAQQDPIFAAQYMREAHPIDWLVRQHQRDGLLQQIGEDPDEFVRRRALELGFTAQPAPQAQPQVVTTQPALKPAAPRPSLVNAPSGGGVEHVPVGAVAAFETVFPR